MNLQNKWTAGVGLMQELKGDRQTIFLVGFMMGRCTLPRPISCTHTYTPTQYSNITNTHYHTHTHTHTHIEDRHYNIHQLQTQDNFF